MRTGNGRLGSDLSHTGELLSIGHDRGNVAVLSSDLFSREPARQR